MGVYEDGVLAGGSLGAGTNSIGDVGLDAGETHIGEVGAKTNLIEITLSLDTSAYADGDVLAATQEIAGAVRVAAGTGVLESITILDKDDQAGALDLLILKTNVSIGTENSAVSITDAAADEIQAVVEVVASEYVDLINSQIVVKDNLGIVLQADTAATSLFIAAISRDTKTYTAAGITLKIGILAD